MSHGFKAGFISPMTLSFGGIVNKREVPWVQSFDWASGWGAMVVVQNVGPSCAGLYINRQGKLRLALKYDDVCILISESYDLQVLVDVPSTVTFPSGTQVYKNGELTGGLVASPDATAIWTIASPTSGGGATAANLTQSDFPGDLPTPVSGDPDITLNNAAIPAGTIKMITLRSVGGLNLGMVTVGLS